MSATGLDVFDRTLHKTTTGLSDLMHVLGSPDRHAAYLALRATEGELADVRHVLPGEVRHLWP